MTKRQSRLAAAAELLSLAWLIVIVVSLAAGGRIFRWEAYVWLSTTALWILAARWYRRYIERLFNTGAAWPRRDHQV